MLAEQRHREILTRLDTIGMVRVPDLASALSVTEETIRRDLGKLHRLGQLQRTHGGAVRRESRAAEIPFEVRRQQNLREKQAIGRLAVELVEEDDIIVVDSSTTALEFIDELPNQRLTLLTNSLLAGRALVDRPLIHVILVGGELDRSSWSLQGPLARHALARFNSSKFFFSCRGVDFERGLSEAGDQHAQFKQLCLEFVDQTFLLADHSKFGVRSKVFFAAVDELTSIVTDWGVDRNAVEELSRSNLRLHIAPEAPAHAPTANGEP